MGQGERGEEKHMEEKKEQKKKGEIKQKSDMKKEKIEWKKITQAYAELILGRCGKNGDDL